jgi:hypothetical protein
MAAEDLNGERSPQGVPTRADHSLDSLARGLATGTVSRRKALRLLGGSPRGHDGFCLWGGLGRSSRRPGAPLPEGCDQVQRHLLYFARGPLLSRRMHERRLRPI